MSWNDKNSDEKWAGSGGRGSVDNDAKADTT